jgi:RecB family exonuclease
VVTTLSYTALAAYRRCGYRFYVERVLGVPPTEARLGVPSTEAGGGDPGAGAGASLTAAERGTLVHALLERLDFRRPVIPESAAIQARAPRPASDAEVQAVTGLLEGFAGSEVRARLARATRVWRERRFGFELEGVLITGALDVIASEADRRTLIVDYKTDRLDRADPATIVARDYGTQQLIYALAALRAGALEVEVAHVFLEAPEAPVSVSFSRDEASELERALARSMHGLVTARTFPVTETPHRNVCRGCPAEGGLCSWPLEMTRRDTADQLF